MIHERWRRLIGLWRREAGRPDAIFEAEGIWSCGQRVGEWGRASAHQAGIERLQSAYAARYQALKARHEAEVAEFQRSRDRHLRRLQAKAERKLEHLRHVELHPDGRIEWVDGPDRVELARFIGSRADFVRERRIKKRGEHLATVLINGDGFDDRTMQSVQAELRTDAQREFGALGVMVVPHAALEAAGIRLETIRRIQVTRDGGENVTVKVEGPSQIQISKAAAEARRRVSASRRAQTYWSSGWHQFEDGKRSYQLNINVSNGKETLQFQMLRQPMDGVPGWTTIRHTNASGWTAVEWRHRLGASVFSAIDGSGERHRFISAFDMNEQPPLYFLAQLPDQGRVLDYTSALDLLAPPIVHAARNEGKQVYRQGDVFFVETELSTVELRRRGGAIFRGNGRGRHADRPRRGRNIYRTGHIATEVCLMPSGVTLAKGTVEHYPAFTEPGRRPEHQALLLPEGRWFFCVRNTVPRSQDSGSRPDAPPTTSERSITDAIDEIAA